MIVDFDEVAVKRFIATTKESDSDHGVLWADRIADWDLSNDPGEFVGEFVYFLQDLLDQHDDVLRVREPLDWPRGLEIEPIYPNRDPCEGAFFLLIHLRGKVAVSLVNEEFIVPREWPPGQKGQDAVLALLKAVAAAANRSYAALLEFTEHLPPSATIDERG